MKLAQLSQIGLTDGEIKVYEALVKHGPQTKTRIAGNASVSSSKVYEIAERLQKKGLVSELLKNGVRTYSAAPPHALIDFIDQKEQRLQQERAIVEEILPELQPVTEPVVELYEGWDGLQHALWEAVQKAPEKSKIHGLGIQFPLPSFIKKFVQEAKRKNILIKSIKTGKHAIPIPGRKKNVKGFEHVGMGVFEDRVIIGVTEKEPVGVVIQHPEISKAFRAIHNILYRSL
ncbi:MAG: hypothetical protein OXR66_02605 [Candidatus Woesearchaeota archaeon]|nr:hypothetical protein [Candidatus Woesearchaeota archaeon]